MAQAFGGGHALHPQRGGCSTRLYAQTALHTYIATQSACLPCGDREARFAERHHAPCTRQAWRVVGYLQVIAGQRDGPLHFGFFYRMNGQCEFESVVCRAGGAGLRQNPLGQARKRRAIDQPQPIGQWSAGLGVDYQSGLAVQVANHGIDLGELQTWRTQHTAARIFYLQAGVVNDEFARQLGECGPG